MKRTELDRFLASTYMYDNFQDYCHNGCQIEGKNEIERIALGVSFNKLFLEEAIRLQADAMIVHHGIFGKNFFRLTGNLKEKTALCLAHNMSLFGIHLPMDAHPEIGHNALLAKILQAHIISPFKVGFLVKNSAGLSLREIIDTLAESLNISSPLNMAGRDLVPHMRQGIHFLDHGPEIPETIGIISGGSASSYEASIDAGADTFICGDIKEQTPGISYESKTNYINLGHYHSEKPGITALEAILEKNFNIETFIIDIKNII